jgi:hypothetical protein
VVRGTEAHARVSCESKARAPDSTGPVSGSYMLETRGDKAPYTLPTCERHLLAAALAISSRCIAVPEMLVKGVAEVAARLGVSSYAVHGIIVREGGARGSRVPVPRFHPVVLVVVRADSCECRARLIRSLLFAVRT